MSSEVNSGKKGLSRIEQVYGFQNEAFREYVKGRKQGEKKLRELYDGMEGESHPVVTYAAGWVLGELATKSNRVTLSEEERHEALRQASELWSYSKEEAAREQNRAMYKKDPAKSGDYYSLGLQIDFTQAHEPSMQAVSSRIATDTTPPDLQEQTYDNVITFADQLKRRRGRVKNKTMLVPLIVGTQSEVLVSSLLHRSSDEDQIAVPSSFRQQSFARPTVSSDIMVHDFSERHVHVPIQVKTGRKFNTRSYRDTVLVTANEDLTFSDTRDASVVLQYLIDEHKIREKGEGTDEKVVEGKAEEVDKMSEWLFNKINTHKQGYKSANSGK